MKIEVIEKNNKIEKAKKRHCKYSLPSVVAAYICLNCGEYYEVQQDNEEPNEVVCANYDECGEMVKSWVVK